MLPAHDELRETSLVVLKDFSLIKQVLWMSTVSRDKTGAQIDKFEQVINVPVLEKQCREILLLLKMKQSNLLPHLSEKRILHRFNRIATVRVVEKLYNCVWAEEK